MKKRKNKDIIKMNARNLEIIIHQNSHYANIRIKKPRKRKRIRRGFKINQK